VKPKGYATIKLFQTLHRQADLGVIRLEEWPEGIVLWIGGEIKYKSWEVTCQIIARPEINVCIKTNVG
jgi:hypothetical protein